MTGLTLLSQQFMGCRNIRRQPFSSSSSSNSNSSYSSNSSNSSNSNNGNRPDSYQILAEKKKKKNTFTSRFVQCHFQLVQKVQYCYQCVFRPAIHFPIHSEFPNMYLFGIITCVFASVVVVVYFMFILITFTIRFSELRYWSFT